MNDIFPYLMILFGSLFAIRNITFLLQEEKLSGYLETSPKARIWLDKYGPEKTKKLAKSVFLPLGIAVSIALVVFGVYALPSS